MAAMQEAGTRQTSAGPERVVLPCAVLQSRHIALGLVLTSLYKVWRGTTPEAVLASTLFGAQAASLLLLYTLSPAASAWFLVIYALIRLLVPMSEPKVTGGMQNLTQRNFDGLTGTDSTINAVIALYSSESAHCHQYYPVIASLANRYAGSGLRFGRIDIARFPDVGERYGIDSRLGPIVGFTLPALLLFQNGSLTARLPAHSSLAWGSSLGTGTNLTAEVIQSSFHLDSWLVANESKKSS